MTHIYRNCLRVAIHRAQDICVAAFGIRQILLAVLLFFFMHVPKSIYLQDQTEAHPHCSGQACPQLLHAGIWQTHSTFVKQQKGSGLLATICKVKQTIHPTTFKLTEMRPHDPCRGQNMMVMQQHSGCSRPGACLVSSISSMQYVMLPFRWLPACW